MGALANLYATLGLDSREFDAGIGKAQKSITGFGKGTDLAIAGAAAAVVGGLGAALGMAREWETAFIGVQKTIDTTGMTVEEETATFAKLEEELFGLSKTIPITAVELAGLAETAGALGIATKDVTEFARVTAMIGTTTNVSADMAATALGKIGTVMGLAGDDFEHFGNTLVALGNDGASAEDEILALANRMAGTAKQVGLSSANMLAWSSAMASVGIEAEAGGSSFQRFALNVQQAVVMQTAKLETLGKVTGMTGQAFTDLWNADSSAAMAAVINGLAELDDKERMVMQDALQMNNEIRLRDFMSKLTSSQEKFNDALALGETAWDENAAMTKEAEKAYESFDNQMILLSNRLFEVGVTLGETLMPSLRGVADVAGFAVDGFQGLLTAFPALTAVVTPLVGALASLVALRFGARFIGLGGAFDAIAGKAAGMFTSAFIPELGGKSMLGKLATIGGRWGKVLGLGAAATIIVILADELGKLSDSIKTQWAALQPVPEGIEAGALSLGEMESKLVDLNKAYADTLLTQRTWGGFWEVGKFALGWPSAEDIKRQMEEQRDAIDAELARIESGERGIEADPTARATMFAGMADAAKTQADAVMDELDKLVGYDPGAIDAPDIAAPIEEEFAKARQAILAGFGSIKEALKKGSRPQLISRDDRLENMADRQRRVQKQLNAAVAADDPWNQRYWEQAKQKIALQMARLSGDHEAEQRIIRRASGDTADKTINDGRRVLTAYESMDATAAGQHLMSTWAAGISMGIPAALADASLAHDLVTQRLGGVQSGAVTGATGAVQSNGITIYGNVYGGDAGLRQLSRQQERATRPTSRNRRYNLVEG